MLKPKSNVLRVVEATLGKVTEVKKPVSKFIIRIEDGVGASRLWNFINIIDSM